MARLRIVLEFSPKREDDIKLYEELRKYSSPSAYVKDALKGLVPLPGVNIMQTKAINQVVVNGSIDKKQEEKDKDEEDLMDI